MKNKIKIQSLVENQLPSFIQEENQNFIDFLKQYYVSQEFQGSVIDIIRNLSSYIKIEENYKKIINPDTKLTGDVGIIDTTIQVESTKTWPDRYGLLKINNEIITYTSKDDTNFYGCIRGFSGITEYSDFVTFESSTSDVHSNENDVINLSVLFLQEFFAKIKKHYLYGFEGRSFYSEIDQSLFLKQSKDFYSSKGTDRSFEILFRALFGKEVDIIKPKDYLIRPSDADYNYTKDLLVSEISGNVLDLKGKTIYQDDAYGSVKNIEELYIDGNYYYKVSLDFGYDRDIPVVGSVFGNFKTIGYTKATLKSLSGSDTITVDSTVGFPNTGTLVINENFSVEYASKTITEFLDCTGITKDIISGSEIRYNSLAYGYDDSNQKVEFRIISVLSNLNDLNKIYGLNSGEKVKPSYPGTTRKSNNSKFNSWLYNVSFTSKIQKIEIENAAEKTYKITTFDKHSLLKDDKINLISIDSNVQYENISVSTILTEYSFFCKVLSFDDALLNGNYKLRKIVSKSSSSYFNKVKNYNNNIQNSYAVGDDCYVFSNSLPEKITSTDGIVELSVDRFGIGVSTSIITFYDSSQNKDHGFYTGDLVEYIPGTYDFPTYSSTGQITLEENSKNISNLISGISSGSYYVKRIDGRQISLFKSKSDLYRNVPVTLGSVGIITSGFRVNYQNFYKEYTNLTPQKFYPANNKGKTLVGSKNVKRLLDKISLPTTNQTSTFGKIGIFVNGVDAISYKSSDKVYYGGIKSVDVIFGGENYDIINPPNILITDSIGSGATCTSTIIGNLSEIEVEYGGLNYIDTPVIEIKGGNGEGAIAKANMQLIDNIVYFDAAAAVSLASSTILFSKNHNFVDGEQVVYKNESGSSIGVGSFSLSNDGIYYVKVIDSKTIKVANTLSDILSNNFLGITSTGSGTQQFRSFIRRKSIRSVSVISSGFGYQNKKRVITSSGINTSTNSFYYENHGFGNGDQIVYSTTGTSISGLSTNANYYLTKLDNDNFKLSLEYSGIEKDFYYKTKQYVNLNDSGSGNHIFNYPPIIVNVIGNVGLGATIGDDFGAILNPRFLGSITEVSIENSGVGYGSSEIINFERDPNVIVSSGSGAYFRPIILNGSIVDVSILNGGSGYTSRPQLNVYGDGNYAKLSAVVQNGVITSVKVITGGINYTQGKTTIEVVSIGKNAKLKANLQSWTINTIERIKENINSDDGYVYSTDSFDLNFGYLYSPRDLRSILYQVNSDGTKNYSSIDLDADISSKKPQHSPILGWAYDGNPIYGPYGYSNASGGSPKILKSGYELIPTQNRPPFKSGFFVEDFIFIGNGDLDENNGRFCVTPEYPKGTYAYFTTIDPNSISSSGAFDGQRSPYFPYIIGDKFKNKVDDFNILNKKQNDFDINEERLIRTTHPYKINLKNSEYEFFEVPFKKLNHNSTVRATKSGKVESIEVNYGGDNYKVGNIINFDNLENNGSGASAEVSYISGRNVVSLSTTSITTNDIKLHLINSNGTIEAISTIPHNFFDNDYIFVSGISTSDPLYFQLEGLHKISVNSKQFNLTTGIGTTGVTGIVTFISVNGNISSLNSDDILGIGTEKVRVLNIDVDNSRIRVERESGIVTSHNGNISVTEIPKTFTFQSFIGFSTNNINSINRSYYFDPSNSAGIGTSSSQLNITLPGLSQTSFTINSRSIYLPNHGYMTGQRLRYSNGSGQSIGVSTAGITTFTLSNNSIVYAARLSKDIIGIATNPIGLGTDNSFVGLGSTSTGLLYFENYGSGTKHSFSPIFDETIISVTKSTTTVTTEILHGLQSGDEITLDVSPNSISTSYTVEYNEYNKIICINPFTINSSGISTSNNLVTKNNHNLVTGDKVVYESSLVASPLTNNQIYYIKKYNDDSFYLYNSNYDLTTNNPIVLVSSGGSSHKFSPINPKLNLYKGYVVDFDLSSNTLSEQAINSAGGFSTVTSFDFKLFRDDNFKNEYVLSDGGIEVTQTGIIGISNNAKVTLNISDNLPNNLYYNIVPKYSSSKTIYSDREVISNNLISISQSIYNKNYIVNSGLTTTFNLINDIIPESNSYDSSTSSITYYTNSSNVEGPIEKVKLISKGYGYKSIPGISSISSTNGIGAILEPKSNTIGKIAKLTNDSLGYEYSSDYSLKPEANIPKIYKVKQLSSVSLVGVSSGGKNYTLPPELLVIDRVTKKVNTNIDISCQINGSSISKVSIINKDYSLYDSTPIIFPQNNTNGIGITYISYNSSTNESTITLNTGFSDPGTFPFSVNQKILVENIGIASTGSGFNSSDYDYQYFTISGVSTNLGGLGTVTYKMPYGTTNPGTYSTAKSYGFVVPENNLPIFDAKTENNEFYVDEEVQSLDGEISNVVSWDSKNKILKVIGNDNFSIGDIILGKSSSARGILLEKTVFDTHYQLNSYENSSLSTWNDNIGFLNTNNQVIPDNFYYQNFSYSLKSEIPYQEWNDSVSSLVHTSGFVKFSDLQIENSTNISDKNIILENESDLLVDLVTEINLDCREDYDYASEKTIQSGNLNISKEIVFKNKILTDYIKSISNLVLKIDDISDLFNSFPRATPYSIVDTFDLDYTYSKYIIFIEDTLYYGERELVVTSLLQDKSNAWMNMYGAVTSVLDLGYFDFSVSGTKGQLIFYPTKSEFNEYAINHYSYRINSSVTGIASTSFGNLVSIGNTFKYISPSGSPTSTNIFSLSTSSYTTSKLLVKLESTDPSLKFQVNEISFTTNGTETDYVDYGQLNSSQSVFIVGLGTFSSSLSGGNLNLNFTPNPGIGVTANVLYTNFAGAGVTGVGSTTLKHVNISSFYTAISSSPTPTETIIASFDRDVYGGSYYMVNIIDTTNNQTEFFEIMSVHDTENVYISKYGTILTSNTLGAVGIATTGNSVILTYTPIPDINLEINVLQNCIGDDLSPIQSIDLNNSVINTSSGTYRGTHVDILREFDLYNNTNPIFEKVVDASSLSSIDLLEGSIFVPNHYFVTGEEIKYTPDDLLSSNAIGIATTSFVGVGSTSLLPSSVYVIKSGDAKIKLARSAEDALAEPPRNINLISLGIGTEHKFTSKKQDTKCLISIDNNIQSPLVATATTTTLSENLNSFASLIIVNDSTDFYGADLIRINDEYMRINSVGFAGSANSILVERAWMGSVNSIHTANSLVRKYEGNYTIIDNKLNFIEPPYGKVPQVTTKPDERDWTGIQTSSTFSGRVFLRSASVASTVPAYNNNYIFDDISSEFDGISKSFTLKSDLSNITDVSTNNGIVLINEIFQSPGSSNNYTLSENVGITSISFVGLAVSSSYDINSSSLPRGGVIISVGSTSGFGYQPLVSAGGTAIISIAGTIQSISIGNSGSGYRSGIQTYVNVSVAKTNISGITTYVKVGVASITNGNITSVNITNPGSGYTSSNSPLVFFDQPLSYSNIPLVYASGSLGVGTEGKVNIIVGKGSSVIDFEIQNFGYNYRPGDRLTIPISGSVGIPTNSSAGSNFKQFVINVERVFNDKFVGWTFGQLQVLDDISPQFDGSLKSFDLTINDSPTSLISEKGSSIKLENNLLVFINDILQVPGTSYFFDGGSIIQFTEAPKGPIDNVPGSGDKASILFYKGSDSDSISVDVLETIKVGDTLVLNDQPENSIEDYWQQNDRIITKILNVDKVQTNSYITPGVSTDTTFLRPLTWCKQKNDVVISGVSITKDRKEYEPYVVPTTRLIQPISTGTTQIYVENVLPLFYSNIENLSTNPSLTIIDVNPKVAASSTAVVSISGTISSLIISEGGVGYTTSPKVSIYSTVGTGASAHATVGSSGTIIAITVTQPGTGYTSTSSPIVLIEANPKISESLSSPTYYGDFGVITGIATTSIVGVATTGIDIDLFIPTNSVFRNSLIVSPTKTVSGIKTGDYIVISQTSIGNSITSLSNSGQIIGIGTTCIDNIYQVAHYSQVSSNIPGVGSTSVIRIVVNVSDYNGLVGVGTTSYYGEYSWGRIDITSRSTTSYSYDVGLSSGLIGLSTSPLIIRNSSLKSSDYNI
jgi:hypothetical protein